MVSNMADYQVSEGKMAMSRERDDRNAAKAAADLKRDEDRAEAEVAAVQEVVDRAVQAAPEEPLQATEPMMDQDEPEVAVEASADAGEED